MDVVVNSVWLNNNHGGDRYLENDSFIVRKDGAGKLFDVRYSNQQFYVSAIDFTVRKQAPPLPEPTTIALFGLGMAGLGMTRDRKLTC